MSEHPAYVWSFLIFAKIIVIDFIASLLLSLLLFYRSERCDQHAHEYVNNVLLINHLRERWFTVVLIYDL